jgi:hypothetical protein
MADHLTPASFSFHHQVDSVQLSEMYGNDYPYMEIIFKTVLDHYDEDTKCVFTAYQQGDVDKLRKAVHKIKPVFGFVGMSPVLEKCQTVEQKCVQGLSISEMSGELVELLDVFREAKMVISSEYSKLVSHNSTS